MIERYEVEQELLNAFENAFLGRSDRQFAGGPLLVLKGTLWGLAGAITSRIVNAPFLEVGFFGHVLNPVSTVVWP